MEVKYIMKCQNPYNESIGRSTTYVQDKSTVMINKQILQLDATQHESH